MASKVKLRMKPIKGNRQSLYLDFYPAIVNTTTGKQTRREFLNMFLFNEIEHREEQYLDANGKQQIRIIPVLDKKLQPKKVKLSPMEKQHNVNTMMLAEQLRQQRDNNLRKPEIYTDFEKERLALKAKGEQSFLKYFESLADERKSSNYDNWICSLQYLRGFTKGELRFSEVDEKLCREFKKYLLNTPSRKSKKQPLSKNSAVSYFNKFKACMNQAFKDGLLSSDINAKVPPIETAETKRNFLTLEELNTLVATPTRLPDVYRRAAVFSAITGLRFSDVKKLVWGEVEYIQGNGYFLRFQQEKTEAEETMPISEQAYSLMGERGAGKDLVFDGLKYSAHYNNLLCEWTKDAGITKHITFHCMRHTYATLQLSSGTDIYTVSKMLGHRDLKTTQVYTKVIDKTKREAANKIQLDL